MPNCSTYKELYICKIDNELYVGDNSNTRGNGAVAKTSFSGTLTIPDTYCNEPVTTIGQYAFCSCKGIDNVIIGSNIKRILSYDLGDLPNIKTIYVPRSLEFISNAGIAFWPGSEFTKKIVFEKGSNIKTLSEWSFGYTKRIRVYIRDIVHPTCGSNVFGKAIKIEILSPYSYNFCNFRTKVYLTQQLNNKSWKMLVAIFIWIISS